MSLDSVDIDENKNNSHVGINPTSSALLCLQKLSEFSYLKDQSDNTTILSKAIDFIRDVTLADYIVVSRLANNKKTCTIHARYGLDNLPDQLGGPQVDIISTFSREKILFEAKDFALRQNVIALLGQTAIKSGISIPIKVDSESHGCLLVCSKKDEDYSSSKVIFLEHVTFLISHYLQQKLLFPFAEQAARKVVEAKKEWEKTIDALPQLVIILDLDGNVVRVNQAIEHWGLGTVSSLNGSAISELLTILSPKEGATSQWSRMWQQLARFPHVEWEYENDISGMSLRFSLRRLHIDSEVNSSGLRHHQGYAVLIVDNITELVEAKKQQALYTGNLEQQLLAKVGQLEEVNDLLATELEQHKNSRRALKQSESRYTHLVENTIVGICVLDDGKIEFCNQRFSEILGMDINTIHGKQLLRLVDPEYRALVMKELNGILLGHANKYEGIIKTSGGANEARWIKIKLNHLSGEEPEKILANIFDVTTQKQIEISLRESEENLHALYGRLINAQENERKRLASELHDGLGQMLSSIKCQVENTMKQLERGNYPNNSNVKWELHTVVDDIRLAIEETRCMAMDLRPTILDDLGIVQTINWFCRQFQQTFRDLRIHKIIAVEEEEVDKKLKLVMYRIIQESFNNVVKHSDANKVTLRLCKTGHSLNLGIEDDGRGFSFDEQGGKVRGGLGLNNMRERAELSGGAFHIDVSQPGGTRVNVIWPVAAN